MRRCFVDTNVLMTSARKIFETYDSVIICGTVLEELDKHKYSSNESKKYQARLATRVLEEHESKIEYDMREPEKVYFGKDGGDNKIINTLKEIYDEDSNIVVLSNDLNFKQKCKCLNIPVKKFNGDEVSYKGFVELHLTPDEINDLYNNLDKNTYKLLENQYVIIHEKGKKKSQEFRYSGGELERLKLPDSKYIKGKNAQQRCALDLLYNQDLPIKIVAGTYGAGKSFLATKMALYHVFEKGNYGTILLLRNPLGSGEQIGFLPGEKDSKIGDFFKCVEQYVDVSLTKDKNINEYIKKDIPYYIKGMSYGSTCVYVEEAEDMDLKILKLIGSRIESDSCVIFCGDYKQSEPKYRQDNGLYQLIEKLKGKPLVGIVVMDEDVRSEASKAFAEI